MSQRALISEHMEHMETKHFSTVCLSPVKHVEGPSKLFAECSKQTTKCTVSFLCIIAHVVLLLCKSWMKIKDPYRNLKAKYLISVAFQLVFFQNILKENKPDDTF